MAASQSMAASHGSTNASVKRTQILSNLCLPKVKFYVYICISNTWVIIHIYIILNIGDISESHLKSHMVPATFRNHLQSYQTVASQWKWSPKCWLLQPSPLGTQPVDSTCFIGAKFSKWSNYGPQGMNQDWVSGIEHNVNPGFNDGFHCGVAPTTIGTDTVNVKSY